MKLKINYEKKTVKLTDTWIFNDMLHTTAGSMKKISGEIKTYLETNENEIQHTKTYVMQQKQF